MPAPRPSECADTDGTDAGRAIATIRGRLVLQPRQPGQPGQGPDTYSCAAPEVYRDTISATRITTPLKNSMSLRRHVAEGQHVLDQPQRQHAGQRAEQRAAAAVHAHAADHGRGEHLEDQAGALAGRGRAEAAGVEHAGERGEHRADDQDDPDRALHPDAGRPRGARVAADRVQRAAVAVPARATAMPTANSMPQIQTDAGSAEPFGAAQVAERGGRWRWSGRRRSRSPGRAASSASRG